MFCEKCGAKLEENARFCIACGEKVEKIAQEEAPQPLPESEEMTMELPEAEVETAEETAQEAAEDTAEEETAEEVQPEPVIPEPVLPEPQPVPVFVAPQPVYVPVEVPAVSSAQKTKAYTPRKKPHIVLRILLQFLSFVMCVVLTASLLGTVVLADLNHLMSAGGIKQLINAVLVPASAPQRVSPAVGALGVRLDETSPIPGFTIPGDLDLGDIPEDLLSGGGSAENISSIIDWIYDELQKTSEEPLPITKEQVKEFVEESTVSEFVADKLAGYADDFINGTEHTSITTEEIMDLLDENSELIEKTFEVEITEEVKEQMVTSVEKVVEENDLNTVIREQVFESVKDTINESTAGMGMSWEEIQPMLQLICSDAVLYSALGTCLVLMLLLCLLNFYNVPAGLTWIAVPSMLIGAIVTAPLAMLQAAPTMLAGVLPSQVASIVASFAGVLLPIHGAVLVMGVALLVISIIWRIIRGAVRRKRLAAAA